MTLVYFLEQLPESNIAYERTDDRVREEYTEELERIETSNQTVLAVSEKLAEVLKKTISPAWIKEFLRELRQEILNSRSLDELSMEELTLVASLDEVCRLLEKPGAESEESGVISFSEVSEVLESKISNIDDDGAPEIVGEMIDIVRDALEIKSTE